MHRSSGQVCVRTSCGTAGVPRPCARRCGLHIFIGPVVGAGLLLLFNDVITRSTEYHGLALGTVVLLFALGFKRGITDFAEQLIQTIRKKEDKQ